MERAEYERMATAEETMWWYRALHARLIDHIVSLELRDGAVVLDAGCGTGGWLRRLGRAIPNLRPVGLEFSEVAVELSRSKIPGNVVQGSVDRMPFQSDTFDAIVSADVLYHRDVHEKAALAEFRRCLKSGGSLLLHVAGYNWMTSSHDLHVHTARRYTARRLRALLEQAGFVRVEVGYRNSLLFPLMVLWRLTAGRHQTTSDTHAFQAWQDRLFYTITSIDDGLAKRGVRFPFGGSVYAHARRA